MKIKILKLFTFFTVLLSISCNPFGMIKYDLTINHNLYVGGRPTKIDLKIDGISEGIFYTPDKKTVNLEKGNHRISVTIYKQKYIVNNGTYEYWDAGTKDIELFSDKTIDTYNTGFYEE